MATEDQGFGFKPTTFISGGDLSSVPAHRLLASANGQVTQNAVAGGFVVGTTGASTKYTTAGAPVRGYDLQNSQQIRIVAGAAIAASEFVTSDNQGRAVKIGGATPTDMNDVPANTFIVGQATKAVPSGEVGVFNVVAVWAAA